MLVSLIAAASENDVIEKDDWMPWDLPAEVAYFRAMTRGKPVIMGRRTFDAMKRPMPNRRNIVVTRNGDWKAEGADVVHSIEEAIELARRDNVEEAMVIGGEQMYRLALPLADRIYLTRVHTIVEEGGAKFPSFDASEWKMVKSEKHEVDAENPLAFTMMVYEKKGLHS